VQNVLHFDQNPAEQLLNNGLQMRASQCNCEGAYANKTNENRSGRTGQGELTNGRKLEGGGLKSPDISGDDL
jgi:hypothetical protein